MAQFNVPVFGETPIRLRGLHPKNICNRCRIGYCFISLVTTFYKTKSAAVEECCHPEARGICLAEVLKPGRFLTAFGMTAKKSAAVMQRF